MSVSDRAQDTPPLTGLLAGGRVPRPAAHGVVSFLGPDDPGSPYDGRAAAYDRVIGSRPYNRIVWSTATADYAAFARAALADGDGPLLDVGCGTLVFTGELYRQATRPCVLLDHSIAMLERAATRAHGTPATLVQGDVYDLPFTPGAFSTVCSFGVLHCLEDLGGALRAMREQLAPGGRLFASSLVAETRQGRPALALLHRLGEVAPPRTEAQFADAVRRSFGAEATVRRTGSMAYATATVS